MEAITNNLPAIALVLAGIGLVVMLVMQSLQISNLRRRVDLLTGGISEGNLEDVLIQHLESVHAVGQDLDELIARMAVLESSARHHYARQGLVRFNPFRDTGGDQSFALALLDEAEDGFIMSSLHSRNGTRIYAKAIVGGKADATLSAEELEAIDEARASRSTRVSQAPGKSRSGAPVARGVKEGPAPKPAAKAAPVRVAAPEAAAPIAVPAVAAAVVAAPASSVVETPLPDSAVDAESESDADNAVRPVAAKGQSKGEMVVEDEAPAEKTGARPGRSGARS